MGCHLWGHTESDTIEVTQQQQQQEHNQIANNSLFSLLNELVLIFETKGGIIDSNMLVWIYIFIWLYLPVSIEVCIIKWDTNSFCFFSITQICYQDFSIYMYTVITGCWIWLFILSPSLLSVWSLFSKAPQGLLGPWHLVHCQ